MSEVNRLTVFFLALCALAVPVFCVFRFAFAIFSPKLRITIRQERRSHLLLVITSVAILLATVVPLRIGIQAIHAAKVARTKNEASQLQTAILGYYTEYAEMPHTTDNATLIKLLTGNNPRGNPRGIAFLSVSPRDMNGKGEMVDAWQRPFRVSFADPDNVAVTSDPPPPR
jgi:hypothetical protein